MPFQSVAVLAVGAGKRKSSILTNYFVLQECLHKYVSNVSKITLKTQTFMISILWLETNGSWIQWRLLEFSWEGSGKDEKEE